MGKLKKGKTPTVWRSEAAKCLSENTLSPFQHVAYKRGLLQDMSPLAEPCSNLFSSPDHHSKQYMNMRAVSAYLTKLGKKSKGPKLRKRELLHAPRHCYPHSSGGVPWSDREVVEGGRWVPPASTGGEWRRRTYHANVATEDRIESNPTDACHLSVAPQRVGPKPSKKLQELKGFRANPVPWD